MPKGGFPIEQLNIEGKRSGEGFVAHLSVLVKALSRALAERVTLIGLTVGRKGFLGYLKALGGSNVVKVIPCGSASDKQANAKAIKVICGANTSVIPNEHWIKQGTKTKKGEVKGATPMTLCEVRVSPHYSVIPNVGAGELAEAISRVLPFTSKDRDKAPALCGVLFKAKDGKLTLVGSDGYRLAQMCLDFDNADGQVTIDQNDLKGVANALRRASRARVSFSGDNIKTLDIETELIHYRFQDTNRGYPEYEKLIPSDFITFAHLDTVEAMRAIRPLLAVSGGQAVDLAIGEGKIVATNPDNDGESVIVADTHGEPMRVRVNAGYLATAFKACAGMVDFQAFSPCRAVVINRDGYQVLVMPMITDEAKKAEAELKAKAEAEAKPTEPKAESGKPKSSKVKQHTKA